MQLSRGVRHRSSCLTSELMPLLSVACTAARRLCLASSSLGHRVDTCTAPHQPKHHPVSVQLQACEQSQSRPLARLNTVTMALCGNRLTVQAEGYLVPQPRYAVSQQLQQPAAVHVLGPSPAMPVRLLLHLMQPRCAAVVDCLCTLQLLLLVLRAGCRQAVWCGGSSTAGSHCSAVNPGAGKGPCAAHTHKQGQSAVQNSPSGAVARTISWWLMATSLSCSCRSATHTSL